MTPRQWWLYRYLLERDPNEWVDLKTICEDCDCDILYTGERYTYTTSAKSHNPCVAIYLDVEAINESPEVDKIILYRERKLKFPTSIEEAEEHYLSDLLKRGRKILARYGQAVRKLSKDGQGKILSNRLVPINDSKGAKEFVEALMRGEETIDGLRTRED